MLITTFSIDEVRSISVAGNARTIATCTLIHKECLNGSCTTLNSTLSLEVREDIDNSTVSCHSDTETVNITIILLSKCMRTSIMQG